MSNEIDSQLRDEGTEFSPDKFGAVPPQLPPHVRIPISDEFPVDQMTAPLRVLQSIQPAQEQLESQVKSKIYGAPRVFDLFTLLAITLAFALLFALLGLLAPALDMSASVLTVAIGGFVTLVGFSQMWLFGSNNPRVASVISGPVALAIVVGLPFSRASDSLSTTVFGSLCFGLFVGPVAGYLGGAVVAGVFLLADQFRTFMMTTGTDSKDARFDDVQ